MAIFIQDPVCAWCDAENGVIPGADQSHGICIYHARQIKQEYDSHKAKELLRAFERVPSYAERFRDVKVAR